VKNEKIIDFTASFFQAGFKTAGFDGVYNNSSIVNPA
jgi:hypothetical protein